MTPTYTAISITQENCRDALGVTPHVFRETVKRLSIRHARSGKSIIVLAKDWEAAVIRESKPAEEPTDLDAVRERMRSGT